MKLTLRHLITAKDALEHLLRSEMGARTAFQMARIMRQTIVELRDYDRVRVEFCERLGTLSEKAEKYEFTPENRNEFDGELKALLDTEIELDIIQIAAGELPNLTPADAMVLEWLVDDSQREETDGKPARKPRVRRRMGRR